MPLRQGYGNGRFNENDKKSNNGGGQWQQKDVVAIGMVDATIMGDDCTKAGMGGDDGRRQWQQQITQK